MTAQGRIDTRSDLKKGILISTLGGILLLACILILGSMILSKTQDIISIRNEMRQKSAQADVLSRLSAEYAIAQPYMAALKNILPVRDKFITFPKELEDLARTKGVSGFSFSFTSEQAGSNGLPGSFGLALNLQGDSAKLIQYLEALHNINYFIRFPSVEITGAGGRDIVMILSGSVYLRE